MSDVKTEWSMTRLAAFRVEVIKLFVAFNKPLQNSTLDLKVDLVAETLHTLPSNNISKFFSHVRATEAVMPSDSALKKILSANYKEFTNVEKKVAIEAPTNLPSDEWLERFWTQADMVLNKGKDPKEAWNELKETK